MKENTAKAEAAEKALNENYYNLIYGTEENDFEDGLGWDGVDQATLDAMYAAEEEMWALWDLVDSDGALVLSINNQLKEQEKAAK